MRPLCQIEIFFVSETSRNDWWEQREEQNSIEHGTRTPQATGFDELNPRDCGRNPDGTGKLCFPDGLLCQNSKSKKKLLQVYIHLKQTRQTV